MVGRRAWGVVLVVALGACATAPTSDVVAPSTIPTMADTTPASSTSTSTSSSSTSTTSTSTTSTASTVAGRPIRVLVVGDSVAASLAGPEPTERIDLGGVGAVEVHNVGSVACPVILEGEWWFSDGSTLPVDPSCVGPERFDDEIASFAPDVVLSLFGWPGAGGGQRFPDGEVSVPCEPRFDRAWASGHRSMIERLAPHAAVVVATVAPIAMDPRRAETACLNRIVRRLPAVVADVQQWLCPDLDCSELAALRPDGVHFAADPGLRVEALEGVLGAVFATSNG